MKIITMNVNKGGTGKSTIAYNFVYWLIKRKQKNVLLIDGDHSCNISYSFQTDQLSSVKQLFDRQSIKPQRVSDTLDFIKGSADLTDEQLELQKRQNNCLQVYMWIADSIDQLNQYDYIVIDTHNDSSLVTKNFLAVSDVVLGICEPSRNGYRAWLELEETIETLKRDCIDIRSRESFVLARPFVLANKVERNHQSSIQFIESLKQEEAYVGYIPKKELLAKSLLQNQSIFEQYDHMTPSEQLKHRSFFEQVEHVFQSILNVANKEELI